MQYAEKKSGFKKTVYPYRSKALKIGVAIIFKI